MAETGSLYPLTQHLRTERSIAALLAKVRTTGECRLFGAPRAAATALAATFLDTFADGAARQLLVVTPQAESAAVWADELAYWLPPGVPSLLFPALDNLPYERAAAESTLVQQRQSVLEALTGGSPVAVVAPARALLQPLMDPATFRGRIRDLRVGGRMPLTSELAAWGTMGYAHVGVVQEPGQYSKRGGIVDVFPAGATWPLRIELVGSEIDSLREFDPATQRSIGSLNAATLTPVYPFVLPASPEALRELHELDCARCLPHLQTQWEEELQSLEQGIPFEGLEFYTPYLTMPSASLLAYLPGSAVVFLDDPKAQQAQMAELVGQAHELSEELVGRGEVPPGLRFPLLDRAALAEELALLPRLEWLATPVAGCADWSAGNVFSTAPSYAGSLKRFVQDCDELRRQQERVAIVSLQGPRLAELLRESGVPVDKESSLGHLPERGSIVTVPGILSEGWYAPNAHIMIFTDAEVAGWNRPRPAARFHRAPSETFALDFAPGEYLVHIEHGICRFHGVVREGAGRAEREYLQLQFAGTDVLKVPTDKLDRIAKYRGMGEASPPLSRLGTQEWTRTKAKVKEAIEVVARDLLELYRFREKSAGHAFAPDNQWQRELEAAFPYEETPDQGQAIVDVKADMEQPHPMDRLVCGDVGYGKTEVAVRAAFKAVMDGMQVAVLVPTTVLAQQHYNTFRERMQAFPVRIGVLSRFHSRAEHARVIEGVKAGQIDIVIGTHRLLQKDIEFKSLGLLVIDEEQRFGVKHKEQLKRFRREVDVLTLTATPIPRSLYMALNQVRELSVIATPPAGRLPIKTFLEPFDEYHIREAILRELDRDGQIYFVHNKVQTIEPIAERLRHLVPNARIGIAHGQLPDGQLERIMFDFAARQYDILICSTIIESGLDIPNVNTMIVNDATNFGLSQLYQLRGRIGRANRRGYAYLLYNASARITRTAERRLRAIFESTELGAGFQIAMIDLEIRGAGNVLGSAQHGQMTAVGFQLYANMLTQAIERQRDGAAAESTERPTLTLSLPVDALIPSGYVEDENQRLRLYQRLYNVERVAEIGDLEAEIRDRFGPLPDPVRNLLATVRIRFKARRLTVQSIILDPTSLVLRGDPAATVFDRVKAYDRYGSNFKIDRGVYRLPASQLAADPLPQIEEILDQALALDEKLADAHPEGTRREPAIAAPAGRTFPGS